MLGFLKKKPTGETVTFKINGMHCTSCSMSIDGELEDTDGVLSASTSYANATTKVTYDPQKTTPQDLKKVIEGLDYSVE